MFFIKKKRAVFFKNWSESVHCLPNHYEEPEDLHALKNIIERAYMEKETIRVVGSGHSFTPLVATSEVLVSIGKLSGIEKIDRENQLVTVWAGTPLKELGLQLHQAGYAMENLGDINEQTIAGAISTGTHGTGAEFGNISTQVHSLTIMKADGQLLHISPNENAYLLNAAKVSLGLLGIIVKVTLRVLPTYQLTSHSYKESFMQCLQQLELLRRSNRNFEFFWFPYTDTVQIKIMNEDNYSITETKKQNMFKKVVIENGLFFVLSEVSRVVPKTAKMISAASAAGVPIGTETAHSHELYATPRLVKFNEMEYCIDAKYMPDVLKEIDTLIRTYEFAVHFPIECRYVKKDPIWLSPSFERDSAYIAIHMYKGMEFKRYFEEVEKIFAKYNGRPHWGKMHMMQYGQLKQVYPKLEEFLDLRKELDPEGMFLNEYVRELFHIR